MLPTRSRLLSTTLVTLLVLTAFLVGYQANSGHSGGIKPAWAAIFSPGQLDDTVSLKPVQLFQEAYSTVMAEYVDEIKNPDDLTYAAIRGMLQEIHDPYTRFMNPKEFQAFNDDGAGHFAGIGATLKTTEVPTVKTDKGETPKDAVTCPVCGTKITDIKAFRITIMEPLPGSPAKAAGLQPGDYILKVDDTSTEGMTVSDAADKIRGPIGTKVVLTIERSGVDKPLTVTIMRANIEVPAVESKMLDDKIGYLRILSFNEKTSPETRAAILDLNKAGARGMVLDLRSNPGGRLDECIKVSSMFLGAKDNVIVSTKGRNRQERKELRIGEQLFDKPMVVLVNKGSASASEILTGALMDYKRATVIGETTFGKALVQTVIPLDGGRSAMPVTTARYYTPTGFDLNKRGLTPNVVVELSKDAKELNEKDNQAQEAIRILQEKMAGK